MKDIAYEKTDKKSHVPLGIPTQVMANPAQVGRELAAKIMLKKPVITPNLQTKIYLLLSRIFPAKIGRFMGKLTARAKNRSQ